MRRWVSIAPAIAGVFAGAVSAQESGILAADNALEAALERGDRPAIERMLDPEFTWITADGIMWPRREALEAPLKPLVGTGRDVKLIVHRYGTALYVERSRNEARFAMHVWADGPDGPKILHINEIEVKTRDFDVVPPDFEVPCLNPCEFIPWVPMTPNQQAAYSAWREQERGPDRSGWEKRVADNLDQRPISTYGGRAASKADRIAARARRAAQNPDAPYVAATPVLWSRWWDVGDEAVFQISLQPTYGDKPYWASRIFARIDGLWQMAESYHTYLEDGPILTGVPISKSHDPREAKPVYSAN
jgi:hypothetical protein